MIVFTKNDVMNSAMRTNNIFRCSDWFQMFWSNTVARVAQVVKGQSIWNRSNELCVSPTVSTHSFVINRKDTVAPDLGSGINPTSANRSVVQGMKVSLLNPVPEPFRSRRATIIDVAMAFPSSVVKYAQSLALSQMRALYSQTRTGWNTRRAARRTTKGITMALPARVMGTTPSSCRGSLGTNIYRTNHNTPPVASITNYYTTVAKEV